MPTITDAGKEEIALALILWKDYKSQGKWDPDLAVQALRLAATIGVQKQYEALLSKIPPMKIEPR